MTTTKTNEAETGLKKIDGMIKGVVKGYSSAQNLVQETAVLIVMHAKDYGDCSRAKALARAVPARERNSLIGWFSKYSPIGIKMGNVAKDDQVRFIKPESKNYNDFDIDGAKANMWYDDPAGANPEPKPLNTLENFWEIMLKMADREIKNAEKTGDDAKYDEADREKVLQMGKEVKRLLSRYQATTIANDLMNNSLNNNNSTDSDGTAPATPNAIPVGVAA